VDEAQDLTPQQLGYLRRKLPPETPVTFAGDDDQAIFGWAGADSAFLQRLRADRSVLPQSHRLPQAIKSVADDVIDRCIARIKKHWLARDEPGEVDWVGGIEEVDLLNGRSWLLLARHRYQLYQLAQLARRQGVVYAVSPGPWSNEEDDVRAVRAYERLRAGHKVTVAEARLVTRNISSMPEPAQLAGELGWPCLQWPTRITGSHTWMEALDRLGTNAREYIRGLRRNKEGLTGPGRVRISTVHGCKGGEADDVLLLTDVARKVQLNDPDSEQRVAYVGVTRARHRLLLCQPQTDVCWKM
jgi:superfamily I DNA/RNA helicase